MSNYEKKPIKQSKFQLIQKKNPTFDWLYKLVISNLLMKIIDPSPQKDWAIEEILSGENKN